MWLLNSKYIYKPVSTTHNKADVLCNVLLSSSLPRYHMLQEKHYKGMHMDIWKFDQARLQLNQVLRLYCIAQKGLKVLNYVASSSSLASLLTGENQGQK